MAKVRPEALCPKRGATLAKGSESIGGKERAAWCMFLAAAIEYDLLRSLAKQKLVKVNSSKIKCRMLSKRSLKVKVSSLEKCTIGR
jgi:hypothetical protein